MRESFSTVSGNQAETTQKTTQRTSNDRNNHPHHGAEGIVLSDSDLGRNGSIRPSDGFCESTGHAEGSGSPVPAEAGQDWQASCGDGRRSGVASYFPPQTSEVFNPEEHEEAIKAEVKPLAYTDIPRNIWDAVNHAIHTSSVNGNERPISLCYVAVRAAFAAQRGAR